MRFTNVRFGAAILVALLLLSGAILIAISTPWSQQARADRPADATLEHLEISTKTGVVTFRVEVARTPAQQAKGLMYRTSLADDRGMLFPHDDPRELSMWMRNTYISLDMLFIMSDGRIHRIEERTEPLSEKVIASHGDVKAVLELAGGAAERLGIAVGDNVRHREFSSAN